MIAAAFLLAVSCHDAARAVPPPSAYDKAQEQAEEILEVEILATGGANPARPPGYRSSEDRATGLARAKIHRVFRTGSGLQPGDEVEIRYRARRRPERNPMPGVFYGYDLRAGETSPAFLRRTGDRGYEPVCDYFAFSDSNGIIKRIINHRALSERDTSR